MFERVARVAAPVALALFAVIGAIQGDRPAAVAVTVALGEVVLGVLIAWRNLTGWPLLVGLAVAAAGLIVLCNHKPSNLGWFGICVVAGWAAFRTPAVQAAIAGAVLSGAFVTEWLALADEPGWGAWISGTVFTTLACTFGRRQRELVQQLREAQAGLAERARAEERNRVAGEVHDVIGHALTVSLLHVSSARLALDEAPDEARASLAEAERLARQSLDEVRAAVGLLRVAHPDEQQSGIAPLPSASDLSDLVESFRRAGSPVALEVRGDAATLNANRGLALYRIVQESLTNAVRHGDGSPVTVRVDVADDATTVTVVSGGDARTPARDGSGLIGMRERAEALGGRLVAGPSPGGWRVEAVLPT